VIFCEKPIGNPSKGDAFLVDGGTERCFPGDLRLSPRICSGGGRDGRLLSGGSGKEEHCPRQSGKGCVSCKLGEREG